MTRGIGYSLVTLSAVGLFAICGCKSSKTLGIVDTSNREATSTLAERPSLMSPAPDGAERATGMSEPAYFDQANAEPETAKTGFSLSRTWRSATSWLPFRRAESQEGRALDRELSLQPIPSKFGQWRSTPGATAQDRGTPSEFSTSAADRQMTTGLLVGHTRRPPPDPAPKPPQDPRQASGTNVAGPAGRLAMNSQANRTQRMVERASLAWQVKLQRAKLEKMAALGGDATEEVAATTKSTEFPARQGATSPAAAATTAADRDGQEIQVVESDTPKSLNAMNTGLTFKKPAIADTAQESGTGPQEVVATGPVAEQQQSESMPRRKDLASASLRKAALPKSEESAESATAWVAKKESAGTSGHQATATNPADLASSQPNSKSLVAETFAASPHRRDVNQPQNSVPADPRRSVFPVAKQTMPPPTPPQAPTGAQPSMGEFVLNPHVAPPADPQMLAGQRSVAPGGRMKSPTADAAAPAQQVVSTVTRGADQQPVARDASSAPSQTWQPPLPVSTNSYESYYHRGVLAGGDRMLYPTQPPQPVAVPAQPVAVPAQPVAVPAQQPQAQSLAPLVNASDYRQQQGTRIPVSTAEPAPQGSWLAAYQRLVRKPASNSNEQHAARATRSISSDQ